VFEADGRVTEGLEAIRLRNVEYRSQIDHANCGVGGRRRVGGRRGRGRWDR
jgi:hypothetical protein